MASMDTDLVRGRVMGEQFRRGRYRLDFWGVKRKRWVRRGTLQQTGVMWNRTLPGVKTGNRNADLKGKLHKWSALIQQKEREAARGKWCLFIFTKSQTDKFQSSPDCLKVCLCTSVSIFFALMWIWLDIFAASSGSNLCVSVCVCYCACLPVCYLTGSCLLFSSTSSCSSVRETREPLSSLSCRGIIGGSRIRGPCMVGPLSSPWPPARPSRL